MTKKEKIMIRERLRCYCWFVLFLIFAIAAIIIINITDYRPFGFAEKYEEINNIIVNLSYSYLAAAIFHIVMIVWPGLRRKRIMRNKITAYFTKMKEAIHSCLSNVHLFEFKLLPQDNKLPSKEEFIRDFNMITPASHVGYLRLLNHNVTIIKLLIDSSLTIQEYLSDEEVSQLMIIKDSLFLTTPITLTDYAVEEDGNRMELPNSNQKEMAESIYHVYELINEL